MKMKNESIILRRYRSVCVYCGCSYKESRYGCVSYLGSWTDNHLLRDERKVSFVIG